VTLYVGKENEGGMTKDKPEGENAGAGGGDKPAADSHEIALAIHSLERQYGSAQQDRTKHDKKTLFWGRLAGWGVWTYTILTILIVCASIYSARQSTITADAAIEANQINSRPYIKVRLETDNFRIHTTGAIPGDFSGIRIFVQNIGRLPGLAWIQDGISWNGRGHPGDESSWQERGVIGKIFLFPEPVDTPFDSEGLVLTQGQLSDLASTGGTLYVMADVLYGSSKNIQAEGPSRDYETKICSLFHIIPASNGENQLRLDPKSAPCSSDGSNYAK